MKNVSVVIPAYNEEATIGKVVKAVDYYFLSEQREIIVVNDNSSDKTVDEALYEGATVISNKKNYGHAKSMLKGFKKAKGDYVLYMDADDQIKMNVLDFDLVSGYRVHRQDKLFRKIVSFIMKMIILVRHGCYIRDANCPFRFYKRSSLQFLMTKLSKNSVIPSASLQILARRYKMRTIEFPVEHDPYIKIREGTLQSLNKKSIKMFWESFKEIIFL